MQLPSDLLGRLEDIAEANEEPVEVLAARLIEAGLEDPWASRKQWDPNHDQGELCECGHTYHRHFDSWENMAPVGCKYCTCLTFKGEGQ